MENKLRNEVKILKNQWETIEITYKKEKVTSFAYVELLAIYLCTTENVGKRSEEY